MNYYMAIYVWLYVDYNMNGNLLACLLSIVQIISIFKVWLSSLYFRLLLREPTIITHSTILCYCASNGIPHYGPRSVDRDIRLFRMTNCCLGAHLLHYSHVNVQKDNATELATNYDDSVVLVILYDRVMVNTVVHAAYDREKGKHILFYLIYIWRTAIIMLWVVIGIITNFSSLHLVIIIKITMQQTNWLWGGVNLVCGPSNCLCHIGGCACDTWQWERYHAKVSLEFYLKIG